MIRLVLPVAGLLLFQASVAQALPESFPNLVERVKRSVVAVSSYSATRRPPLVLLGTGFAVADGRLVATAFHVVDRPLDSERNEQLVVAWRDGGQSRFAKVQIAGSDRRHDLALLRVERKLPALALHSREVREGEEYAFTGFPVANVLGLYPVTHRGIVSSVTPIAIPVGRSDQLTATKINRLRNPVMVYQLDATAYPGNSGSPLYDPVSGEVAGILNQVYVKTTKEDLLSEPSGISFAVPVEHLKALLESLE